MPKAPEGDMFSKITVLYAQDNNLCPQEKISGSIETEFNQDL